MHDSHASDRPTTRTGTDAAEHWMHALTALPCSSAPLPDAQVLWWQAQALRRLDEQRRLTAQLEIGERIQAACLTAGMLALFGWMLARMPGVWQLPSLIVAGAMCAALVALAAVMAPWERPGPGDSRMRNQQ